MEISLTIQRRRKPLDDSPEELLDYILSTLGFQRDLYRSIVSRLIHNELSSTELSRGLAKRTTVIYHVNKLLKAGIVVRKGNRYELREPTFERTVEEILRDVERVFEDLLWAARKLDEKIRGGEYGEATGR